MCMCCRRYTCIQPVMILGHYSRTSFIDDLLAHMKLKVVIESFKANMFHGSQVLLFYGFNVDFTPIYKYSI